VDVLYSGQIARGKFSKGLIFWADKSVGEILHWGILRKKLSFGTREFSTRYTFYWKNGRGELTGRIFHRGRISEMV